MLSRVADAIFWMSRYMERTKMETTLLLTNYVAIQDNAIDNNWKLILDQYGEKTFMASRHNHFWKSSEALLHLITDKENANSIGNNIIYARENARSIQDNITKELWQTLNNFYHIVKNERNEQKIRYEDPVDVMDVIIHQCYLYYGTIDITIARGEGYHFMNVGKHLERATQTIQIVCIKLKEINFDLTDDANILSFRYLLYALSGYELFGKTYKGEINCSNIIHHVLFNPIFTHSVIYSLDRVRDNFSDLKEALTLGAFSEVEFEIGKLISNFTYSEPDLSDGNRLFIYLEDLKNQINHFSTRFSKIYFGQS